MMKCPFVLREFTLNHKQMIEGPNLSDYQNQLNSRGYKVINLNRSKSLPGIAPTHPLSNYWLMTRYSRYKIADSEMDRSHLTNLTWHPDQLITRNIFAGLPRSEFRVWIRESAGGCHQDNNLVSCSSCWSLFRSRNVQNTQSRSQSRSALRCPSRPASRGGSRRPAGRSPSTSAGRKPCHLISRS